MLPISYIYSVKTVLTILLLAVAVNLHGQNLLANGSFEMQTNCPDETYLIENALYWDSPNFKYYRPNLSTCATLYDSCADFSINVPDNPAGGGLTQDGHAYIGFYPLHLFIDTLHLKDYIQTEIINPLKPNIYYCFKMYIKLANYGDWAINDFSVYFSQQKLRDSLNPVLDYIDPQITNTNGQFYTNRNTWKEYTGYFKADGGEKYLTIGSFLPTDSTPKIPMPGQFNAAYYFIDNVQLYECGDSLNTSINEETLNQIILYPNPTTGNLTVELNAHLHNANIEVFDMFGKLVYSVALTNNISTLNLPIASNGLYYVRLWNNNEFIKQEKLILIH